MSDGSGGRGGCRRERLGLECPRGRAQLVLYRIDVLVELGRTVLTPERHFGQALIERLQHIAAHPLVTAEEIRRNRDGLRMGALFPQLERRFQVECVGAEDLERADILVTRGSAR